MGLGRQVCVITVRDLRTELRNKEAIIVALVFAVILLVLFSFAVDLFAKTTTAIAGA